MREWWNKKKAKSRKRRKGDGTYSFADFFFDVLLWLPEVIFLPFRMLFWLFRGLGRAINSIFDVF